MTVLQTERLILRPWRESDRAPWRALNADPEVMAHFPAPLTAAESDHWFEVNRDRVDEHGWGLWAVEVAGGAPFIGFVGLAVPGFEASFTPCVEVGWRLAHDHWGRGYAPEAARAALAHGFGELGFDEIVSFTAVGNTRSRRVMEKLGMVKAFEFDHPTLPDHPLERHVLYGLGRDRAQAPSR